MVSAITGHCSQCHKVWTLETGQGLCQWCGKPAVCQNQRTQALRSIKSIRKRVKRQAEPDGNGYDQLDGDWLTYYKVASRFSHKAKVEDREDLLHNIIIALADVARNNGHKPFTEPMMYRVASVTVAHYWYRHYKITNGLDCGHCSKAQKAKCKGDWLYSECPKAIKLEYLDKPILDDEGNLTELGELIADDKAIDLDAWVSDSTWEIGYPKRLVEIAYKLKAGLPLAIADRKYLWKWRQREQKRLV